MVGRSPGTDFKQSDPGRRSQDDGELANVHAVGTATLGLGDQLHKTTSRRRLVGCLVLASRMSRHFCFRATTRTDRDAKRLPGRRLSAPCPPGCVRPLRPGSPRHQGAARAHPVDGERGLGDLVKRAWPNIAKELLQLGAGQCCSTATDGGEFSRAICPWRCAIEA
jgi:hypothetical protein